MQLRKNKKQNFHIEIENGKGFELHQEANIEIKLNEEDILEMILLLPEHYRVIFNLYIIEGYSHSEIGKLLDIPESTSRTKLTRARRKMQAIYRERTENKSHIEENRINEISKIS